MSTAYNTECVPSTTKVHGTEVDIAIRHRFHVLFLCGREVAYEGAKLYKPAENRRKCRHCLAAIKRGAAALDWNEIERRFSKATERAAVMDQSMVERPAHQDTPPAAPAAEAPAFRPGRKPPAFVPRCSGGEP